MKHTIYADLDTMVFEGREKNYGAYEMRKKYNRILNRSMLIAMLLFLSVTGLPKVIKWIIPAGTEAPPPKGPDMIGPEVVLDLPKEREDVEEPPLPPEIEEPKPVIEEQVKTIMLTVLEPSPDEDPDLIVHEMDSLIVDNAAIGDRDMDGVDFDNRNIDWDSLMVGGPGDGPGEVGPVFEEDPKPGDFFAGEEPRPINMEEFKKTVGYPPMAVEAGIEGKVIVRVMVDELGYAKKHIVLKDPHPILTNAVAKKVTDLRFTPGIQGNKPVKVWVTIPIDFVLNN